MDACQYKRAGAFAALAVVLASPSAAYYMSLKGPQHERLTALAEQCLANFAGAYPQRCTLPATEAAFKGIDWEAPAYLYPRASR